MTIPLLSTARLCWCCWLLFLGLAGTIPAWALPQQLGDLDEDGNVTVLDLVRLLRHLNGTETLSTNLWYFADVNDDGFVNDADADQLANAVLNLVDLPGLPFTRVRETSPTDGESDVALTRRTILRFTQPLATDSVVKTNTLYAEAGGRRLLSRAELSSDRRVLTLFYLENLPGNAEVDVTFDSAGLNDFLSRPVDGSGTGVGGGRYQFSFTTAQVAGAADTAVIGRVLASAQVAGTNGTNLVDHPLEGVRVSVDGMEETLFTTTDAQGNFRLEPAPAGRFFVHIDGRTGQESQWPAGAYYPVVGKAWEAIGGVKTNLAGGTGVIYLPLIPAGTLQPVSATADTSITFPPSVRQQNPALADVSITVPANSLFSDNGTRGGKVGIAPVPPDRLPSPLPEGLNFPVVITVQTDGPSNFDRPAPARFPNLPDPVTGKVLPPGAKSALWSFNHDTGEWELQGQMTVSADGRFVETDAGVGIRQPGWHGSVPAAQGKGGKIKPPKKPKPCQPGEPCDDGDPCTTNDRCQGGICKGDPPSNTCPAPDPFTPIHFQWSESVNAGKMSYTLITDFNYSYVICYDPGCHGWRLHVASMDVEGVVRLSNIGSQEPNPVEGGNVTSANYCDILDTLGGYLGRGRGKWHMLEATRVHEYYHRDVELPAHLWPFWQTAEASMESFCVPCQVPEDQAERMLRSYADAVFQTMQQNFWAQQIEENKKHNELRNDAPYQEAQKVLDAMAARVRDFAAKQGFPTCPIRVPSTRPIHLVRIEATARTNVIDVGGTVQIQVAGFYSDGTTRDLTAGSTETTYSATDPQKLSISTDGLATGLKPGKVIVVVSHQAEGDLDGEPQLATVSLTIRSPEDMDNDGMPDDWERKHGLNPNDPTDANQDRDGDGLSNLREYQLGTDPNNPDTDGDGVPDGVEVREGTDPLVADSDVAGPVQTGLHYYALLNLTTGQVEQRGKTDSNGQAFHNLILTANAQYRVLILQAKSLLVSSADFFSPDPGLTADLPALVLRKDTSADSDQDGLSDLAEFILGTNPQVADSDGDGVPDGRQFLPDQYPISIGDVVGNGIPTAGAGNIERPGAKDFYTFTAAPGQMVFLALVTNTIPCCVDWQLEDDEGNLIFQRSLQDGNAGRITLDKGGLYTLTVGGGGTNQTGSYQFKLWDVVPQQFAIKIGDSVTNGLPAAGAGNLETPGALDVYTFTARTNQQVYFDFGNPPPGSKLQWELDDVDGYLDDSCVACLNPGVITLTKGGIYTLTMGYGLEFSFDPTPPDTGTYGFKIWDVPPAQQFAISIGDVVTNGVPAAGAGVIETPGVQDVFTFAATPGQRVYFQTTETFDYAGNLVFLGWALRDQDGRQVFADDFATGDPGAYTLTRGGTYTLTVDDRQFFTTGPYAFQTWNVPPPSQFAIQLGDTVQEGNPGPGAGRIESPGAKDVYTFTAPPGTLVSFRITSVNPPISFARWSLVDEGGNIIFDTCLGCSDPGTFTLSRGGTYTLTVGADRDPWTGTYQFEVKQQP